MPPTRTTRSQTKQTLTTTASTTENSILIGRKRPIKAAPKIKGSKCKRQKKNPVEEGIIIFKEEYKDNLDLSLLMDGGVQEEEVLELNPLNIPSIAGIMLSQLPFNDLVNARLVSNLWAEEATKLLENRAKFRVTLYENMQYFIDCVKENFSSDVANPIIIPSSKSSIGSLKRLNIKLVLQNHFDGGRQIEKLFKIAGHKINSVDISIDVGSQGTIWKMFHKYAPNLSEVTLSNDSCSKKQFLICMHQSFFESQEIVLKSVKKLNVIQNSSSSNDTEEEGRISHPLSPENSQNVQKLAVLLLNVLPNLETLSMQNEQKDYGNFVTRLMELSNEPDFKNNNPKLKQLNFELNLNEEETKTFQEKFQYPLTHLKMSLRPGLRFSALYSWLTILGRNLKSLELDFVLIPSTPETFPCGSDLVNLTNLTLKNYYGEITDFLTHMKNLKYLSLINVNLSIAFRDEPESSCNKMSSLEIISGHSSAGRISFDHIFRKIGKLFPGLRKFRANCLSDSNLKILAQSCPKIEELLLPDALLTDSFTGFSLAQCSTLQSKVLTEEGLNLEAVKDNDKTEPGISDFKHLRKLHLASPRITDAFVLFGLAICYELKDLCLSSPQITKSTLQHAITKMNLKTLRLSECYRLGLNNADDLNLDKNIVVIIDEKCPQCGTSD